MTKIRFYHVQLKDGHDEWSEVVPAHSAGNAEAYNNNPHIKAQAEFLGFYEVQIDYNGYEVIFDACNKRFTPEDVGYNYLYEHLRVSIDEMLSQIDH